MDTLRSIVIGAGQAGLSTAYHLKRLGLVPYDDFVVLDANAAPGGAWQHRWDSLTMRDVHGVASLPDRPVPPEDAMARANAFVPDYFADYEDSQALPIIRPVHVDRVRDADGLLLVEAGDRSWLTRTIVNATGTWDHPFLPHYPGAESFAGEQSHPHDYPGPRHFTGQHVIVVGGGASAVQLLAEISEVATTTWVTRRPPIWRTTEFTPEDGRAAVAKVIERVSRGLPPQSVVSVTGLALREQEMPAARRGVYRREPMFERIGPDGVYWPPTADGTPGRFERADAILWATGFRPTIGHLAPLRLKGPAGGIQLDQTTAVADPRVQLVGYGPSASTIGANRAGRVAATRVLRIPAVEEFVA